MIAGNHFCKVDLHVHTPMSECFIEPDVTPDMIVSQSISAGMKAIAITDHNTAEWVDLVKHAAIGTSLTVFPGVEITVQPGVHILAIFPEHCSTANVTDLLTDLGLRANDRGKNDSLVKESVFNVITIIKSHNALPILAHIDDEKGIWKVLSGTGQTFIQFWQTAEFAAVEIVGDSLPEAIGKNPFSRLPAYYRASDNPHPENQTKHSHKGIGNRFSQFKLSEPITWEGLRLCFQDPSSRIRLIDEIDITHPIIESISIQGGFLNNFKIELNANLNCFIGGRGTGKSCLFEVIRYTFGLDPKTNQNDTQAKGIIKNTFLPGSKACVQIRLGQDMVYRIERASEGNPQIYRFGEQEAINLQPKDLLAIQVYGQKEVYEISRDPTFQLILLDNYLEETLRPLKKEEGDFIHTLKGNATQIQDIEREIEEVQGELENLGSVNEQLRRMNQQNFIDRLQQKSFFDREKELIDNATRKLDGLKNALSTFLDKNRISIDGFNQDKIEELPNWELLEKQRLLLIESNQILETCIHQITEQIQALQQGNTTELDLWKKACDEQDAAYQILLQEFQMDGSGLSPDRYIHLQREQRRLLHLSDNLKEITRQLEEAKANRKILLENLRRNRRNQFEKRQKKAQELSTALGNRVRITIWPQGNRVEYHKLLSALVEGTRTRKEVVDKLVQVKAEHPERNNQQPVMNHGVTRYLISEIPRYLDQIDLAKAIREEAVGVSDDESELLKLFGIDSGAMRRNLSTMTPEKLFELEIMDIPDLPVIELKVGGGEFGYKHLDNLSVGQKCTALLSIVLLESTAPLLIDQPEDDLDNHFIFDQIVATLRDAKEKRQFLIATHNANIPVSGDAELIVVLNADESHGWIEEDGVGSIDTKSIKQSVERILEGGENAFKIRKEKYGI